MTRRGDRSGARGGALSGNRYMSSRTGTLSSAALIDDRVSREVLFYISTEPSSSQSITQTQSIKICSIQILQIK